MATATATITRRSRTVGFSWSNQPVQTPTGLVIEAISEPEVVGTVRQCDEAYERAARINRGNDWRPQWFVSGHRVVGVVGWASVSGAMKDLAGGMLVNLLEVELE